MIKSISYVREHLNKVVDSVVAGEPTVIFRNSDPVAVILDVNEYRALKSVRRLVEQDPQRLLELDAAYSRASSGQRRGKKLTPDPLADVAETAQPASAVTASGS